MTIKNIRNFIKSHKELLIKQNIYKEHYKFSYKTYNILDVAGFLHRIVCAVIGSHNNNLSVATPDALLHKVSQYFNEIVDNLSETQQLYMVFDPIEVNTKLPYAKLKLQTIQKRSEYADNYKDIVTIKKLLYFFMKEQYGDLQGIHIIVSQLEADIMVGSIIKQLLQKNINNSEITVISTDCDMLVQAQGCLYQDATTEIDTEKLFNLFNLTDMKDIACVPEYLGCDYTQQSHNLQFLSQKQNFNYNSLIYKIYRDPEEIENNMELTYENPQWREELNKIFKSSSETEESITEQLTSMMQ